MCQIQDDGTWLVVTWKSKEGLFEEADEAKANSDGNSYKISTTTATKQTREFEKAAADIEEWWSKSQEKNYQW